jgi:hypothetical protein
MDHLHNCNIVSFNSPFQLKCESGKLSGPDKMINSIEKNHILVKISKVKLIDLIINLWLNRNPLILSVSIDLLLKRF